MFLLYFLRDGSSGKLWIHWLKVGQSFQLVTKNLQSNFWEHLNFRWCMQSMNSRPIINVL
jgi:hypothetical protein